MKLSLDHRLEDLKPKFRLKLLFIFEQLTKKGIGFEMFAAVRTPQEQAELWIKSRSTKEIKDAVAKLSKQGAPWLSRMVKTTHRPYGRWETNNLPGLSWHQWGEAASIRILSNSGRVIWNPNNEGYRILADLAQMVSLTSGFFWKRRDVVNVQFRADAVRAYYTWAEVDREMKEKFDGLTVTDSTPDIGSTRTATGRDH